MSVSPARQEPTTRQEIMPLAETQSVTISFVRKTNASKTMPVSAAQRAQPTTPVIMPRVETLPVMMSTSVTRVQTTAPRTQPVQTPLEVTPVPATAAMLETGPMLVLAAQILMNAMMKSMIAMLMPAAQTRQAHLHVLAIQGSLVME